MTVSGGDKLRESLRAAMALPKEIVGEVGFKDKRIASIAATHEFGLRGRDGGVKLPERAAFRQGTRRAEDGVRKGAAKIHAHDLDADAVGEVMVEARDEVRASYRGFKGAPLSERQEGRKRGTPGQGRQLVGHEGEKLIGHVGAFVDDEKVG